jgi:predicted dehydrogenase
MVSDQPVAAVIGTGFVGAQHVDALRRIGVDVRVVAASTDERGAAAARALGVAAGTGDWASAATDVSVDVVHVCVPNDLHRPVVLAALDAGKHVICEKPLGTSLSAGIEMLRAAERADRTTVLCHNYRFYPMVAELRLRVGSGALGKLHAVRGHYLQDWLLRPDTSNWRVDPARGGPSRALADIGSHLIDLAEVTSGRRLLRVLATIGTLYARRPDYRHRPTFTAATTGDGESVDISTEDQAALLLEFEGGLGGSAAISQVAAGHGNDLEVSLDGAEASATWRQERPDQLWIGEPGVARLVARSPSDLGRGAQGLARLPAGHNEGWADALRNLIAAAYAEMRGERDVAERKAAPLPTFADGVRHLAFVEAAMRSAAEERWVAIAELMDAAPAPLEVT